MSPLCHCYSQQHIHSRHLHDRREYLIVINVVYLRVALGHQSGLVPIDRAISVVFYLIHPLASDRLYSFGGINHVLDVIFSQCMHFFLHGRVGRLGRSSGKGRSGKRQADGYGRVKKMGGGRKAVKKRKLKTARKFMRDNNSCSVRNHPWPYIKGMENL